MTDNNDLIENDLIEGALDEEISKPLRRVILLIHRDLVKLTTAASSMAASVSTLNAKVDELDARATAVASNKREIDEIKKSLEKRESNETWLRRAVITALIAALVAIARDGLKF